MGVRVTAASSQYLDITSGLPNMNDLYTVMFWMTPNAEFTNLGIFHIGVSAGDYNDADWVYFKAFGTLRLGSYNGGGGVEANGAATVTVGTPMHVTMVRSADATLDLYVNGVSDATSTQDIIGRGDAASMTLGQSFGIYGSFDFEDMKFWSRALAIEEIRAEMRRRRPLSYDSLYGYWPFRPGSSAARPKEQSGRVNHWTEHASPIDSAMVARISGGGQLITGMTHPAAAAAGQPTVRRFGMCQHAAKTMFGRDGVQVM